MKRNCFKIIGFLTVLILCGIGLARVFCFKYADGILQMENFYQERRNSIDVLCLGSSHMFVNISPKALWEHHGIASYDLGGSVQPFWNTYFYLKEALDYQKPKVVVLDVYCATLNKEFSDHSRIIKNTFGISSLPNRFRAIKISSPQTERIHYWLAYPSYHQRYGELTKADFYPQYYTRDDNNEKTLFISKGEGLATRTSPQMTRNIQESQRVPLLGKSEEYLSRIIHLCADKHIPLLLIVAPYAGDNVHYEAYYARVKEIAHEKGIPYVNFNLFRDEIGIDFSTDAVDVDHLNYRGSEKFSRYLGTYLKKHYDLPDHRGEEEYASYDEMCRILQWKINNQELQNAKAVSTFLDRVKQEKDRYLLVVGMQGDCRPILQDVKIREKLAGLGISVDEVSANDAWVLDAGKECFHAGAQERFDWHMLIKDGFVRMFRSASGQPVDCNLNREQQVFVPQGLSIVVFDKEMEHIIDRAGFSIQDGRIGAKQPLGKAAT